MCTKRAVDRQIALERRDSYVEGYVEGYIEGYAKEYTEEFEASRAEELADVHRKGKMLGIITYYKRLGKTIEDTANYLRGELGLTKHEAMERVERNW